MLKQSEIESLPGIKKDVSLASYSTFKIGGPADWFLRQRERALHPILMEYIKGKLKLKIPRLNSGSSFGKGKRIIGQINNL